MNKILGQMMLLTGLLTLLLQNVCQAQLRFLDDNKNLNITKRIFEIGAKDPKSDYKTDEFLFDFSPNGLLSYRSNYCDACCCQSEAYSKLLCSRFPINTSEVMTRYHLKMSDTLKNSIPPLKDDRITSQVIFGSLGSIVGMFAIAGLAIATDPPGSHPDDDSDGLGVAVILCIGSTLGSATTVYGIGTIGEQTGSFWATLGGSIVGGLIQYRVFMTTSRTPIQLATIPLQAVLATLAFNLTRKWDKNAHSGALMRMNTDKWSVDLLSPYLIPVFACGEKICWQLNLVNIAF